MGQVKGKTGTVRSIVLTPEQEARKDLLVEESGLNFNALMRLLIERITPEDIRALQAR